MATDVLYTNGVIAVKENSLLKSKLLKMCEGTVEDAFKTLAESGFARDAEAVSSADYEALLRLDERDLDGFVREYAPTNAEKAYFLAPRDFHNAKAVFKGEISGSDTDGMLAPDGLVSAEVIAKCFKERDFSALYPELKSACEQAVLSVNPEAEISSSEIGLLFERALYGYLLTACKRNGLLKKFIKNKSDMTDILTAFRSQTPEYAVNNAILAGKIKPAQLQKIFTAGEGENPFSGTDLQEFYSLCAEAKSQNKPFTRAERMLANADTEYLFGRKYTLVRSQPFLYYVLRRKAENADLRIIFVCLSAGLEEGAIKARLRSLDV